MHRFLLLVTAMFALALSKSTIDDTRLLFSNTVKRWNVQIKNKRDFSERYNRLLRMKRSHDETSSGVMLDSLNRFAVNNDEEHEALLARSRRLANASLILAERSAEEEEKMLHFQKREFPPPEEVEWSNLPSEYQYWEKTLGMSPIQDQMGCGSCWSFPAAAAMEALYKKITGEDVVFSKQYFIDCTFTYSGCSGGTINEGFKVTKDRQYLMSESKWPLTADYHSCSSELSEDIILKRDNAMKKAYLQDWYPLGKGEEWLLGGLKHSPVAFGSYISDNYFGYTNGLYDDSLCATDPIPHAQLLVGYTQNSLRVRGSYGVYWGDYGYINYQRGSGNLDSCRIFDTAYAITMTLKRDIEYEFCNDAKPTTRAICRESCLSMNKEGETGWDLAIIPTLQHNNEVCHMANARWPGVKSDDKFNLLWIGITDPDKVGHYHWVDKMWKVNYFNYTRETGEGKFGLVDKNDGHWTMKNSLTYLARGVCSRARTCYDISSRVKDGEVTFSNNNPDDIVEGTTATISCNENCELSGTSQLVCQGGHWFGPGGREAEEPPEDPLADIHPDRYIPTCSCPQEAEQEQQQEQKKKKEKKKKEKKKKKRGKRGVE